MEQTTPIHYRLFLEREYQTRIRKNPGYSLRAFARDIEMQPSKLSEVLRGVRGLSKKTAEKVARNLRLTTQEHAIFLGLIDLHQTKNKLLRKDAEEKLQTLNALESYEEISLERFRIISDWYHFAILEMTELDYFESNTTWIAGRLGISSKLAKEAIERLFDFGLLKKDENNILKQTHINLSIPGGIPSREMREHHSQILMKAEDALQSVDIKERDFSAITLAFHSGQMEEVRTEIKELRRRLGKTIQEHSNKDKVYCLAIQFFPVDKNLNNEREI